MIMEPLEEKVADRVSALTQSTSPRAVIALQVEEAFLDLSERMGVDWADVAEPSEADAQKIVIIVAASMAAILNDSGGLSRATSMSESALGYSQSMSLSRAASKWMTSEDVRRVAKILGLTPEGETKSYPIFTTLRYGIDRDPDSLTVGG